MRGLAALLLASAAASVAAHETALGSLRRFEAAPFPVPPIGIAGPPIPALRGTPGDPGIDLSGQFPTASRDQHDVGSCHTFTAVGLLEAAYYRRTGEHARFSEADLYLRYRLMTGSAYDAWVWMKKPELAEGGMVKGDIEAALRYGVATTPQYEDFLERYRRYREAEQRTMADIERRRALDPWYVRLLYDPRRHWQRLQQDPAAQRMLQDYLIGSDPALEREREENRRKLAGLSVDRRFYVTLPSSLDAPADACRRDGKPSTDFVMSELRAGRPVGVSYFTDKKWGSHVLIIKGYRLDESGAVVFTTRNSWGASGNFDLQTSDMCKVHQVASVR
ncbi:MAG: hypothetical protein HYZ75_08850 [Elusimicrobia bacterium]|nr:hypothetical protein [Elusimicrobiota bacterium]